MRQVSADTPLSKQFNGRETWDGQVSGRFVERYMEIHHRKLHMVPENLEEKRKIIDVCLFFV